MANGHRVGKGIGAGLLVMAAVERATVRRDADPDEPMPSWPIRNAAAYAAGGGWVGIVVGTGASWTAGGLLVAGGTGYVLPDFVWRDDRALALRISTQPDGTRTLRVAAWAQAHGVGRRELHSPPARRARRRRAGRARVATVAP